MNTKTKPKVIAIAAPTASGKTAYAIELAKQIDGEIISADSRIIYKGFDIVCAKPTKEEMQSVPHYMIDIVEPEVDYSVANYVDDATVAINNISAKGKTPIVVGGTGLYFKALLEGWALPRVEPNYELREELEKFEIENLLEQLKTLDEKTYNQMIVEPKKRKIIRAIEVCKSLGEAMSNYSNQKETPYEVEWIGIGMTREELYERVNKRVDIMVERGAVQETETLLKKHGRIKNLISTIGYNEIIQYLDKEITLDRAIELIKQHSRNYAKRQLTWFRKNANLDYQDR